MRPKATKIFGLTFFRNISRILGGQLKMISPLLPLPFPIFPSLCFFPSLVPFPSPCLLSFHLSNYLPLVSFPSPGLLTFPLYPSLPLVYFPSPVIVPLPRYSSIPLSCFPSSSSGEFRNNIRPWVYILS